MIEKIFTIKNKLGLHARPASLFVQLGAQLRCRIQVTKIPTDDPDQEDDMSVNGKSVMGLMMLAAAFGEKVKITLDGEGENEAMRRFEELFERKFDEE